MGNKTKIIYLCLIIVAILALAGCVPGDGANTPANPAGFFWGIWHGWLAPISLLIGLVNGDIRVYEVHNIGWWYDLGFYVAIIGGFGGFSLFRKGKKGRRSDDF
jgi:hypothetical protein